MSNEEKLSLITKLGYGMGHVGNDMTCSMLFSYFLLFFHNVLQLSNAGGGLIIMVGQIVDAISSILVGVVSDKDFDFWIYSHYGKRNVIIYSR